VPAPQRTTQPTNDGDQQRLDPHPDAAHYPDSYTDPERETGHRSTDGTLGGAEDRVHLDAAVLEALKIGD
jgi:hypothetical protein